MKFRWSSSILIGLVASVLGGQQTNRDGSTLQELLAQRAVAVDTFVRPVEREALARLYREAGLRPLWSGEQGPTRQALAAIDVLSSSDTRGLPSARYDVASLRAYAAVARNSGADAARFELALSSSMIRFLADLRIGRVDGSAVGFEVPNVVEQVNLASLVAAVAQSRDVPATVTQAEPPYAAYGALERALARYRMLAADTTLRVPQRSPRTIRPGDRYEDLPALTRLLNALGDLDAEATDTVVRTSSDSTSPPVYDGKLVDAVVRFQRRHGLEPDGALGPATMAELRVPLTRRVRQIELTLERWRWLPHAAPSRYVVVNIPGFRLYVFENDSAAQRPVLAMNVIVGQAQGRHHTPVFSAIMREVVFRPYWDVPPRIARAELIPIFRRRPEYFANEGFEIVRRGTADVDTTTFPPTAENLARVTAGELRVRQRPGPANALGWIKFVFPNRYNVFLHDTPTRELFAQSRRDFSHGCIRAQAPRDMAELVLRGQSPWNREAIDSVIAGTRTVHVPIARPLSVFVVYATATADASGVVSFHRDLYGHDATLERVLGFPPVIAPRPVAKPR